MSRKRGFNPFVFLEDDLIIDDPDPTVTGGSSNQSGVHPIDGATKNTAVPVAYAQWITDYGTDINGNGELDPDDYRSWWLANGFSDADWALFNGDVLSDVVTEDPVVDVVSDVVG